MTRIGCFYSLGEERPRFTEKRHVTNGPVRGMDENSQKLERKNTDLNCSFNGHYFLDGLCLEMNVSTASDTGSSGFGIIKIKFQ